MLEDLHSIVAAGKWVVCIAGVNVHPCLLLLQAVSMAATCDVAAWFVDKREPGAEQRYVGMWSMTQTHLRCCGRPVGCQQWGQNVPLQRPPEGAQPKSATGWLSADCLQLPPVLLSNLTTTGQPGNIPDGSWACISGRGVHGSCQQTPVARYHVNLRVERLGALNGWSLGTRSLPCAMFRC